jgi:uncharacterized membrane protein
MIQALRQTHRRIIIVLAVVVVLIFITGLWARQPWPISERLPVAPNTTGGTP